MVTKQLVDISKAAKGDISYSTSGKPASFCGTVANTNSVYHPAIVIALCLKDRKAELREIAMERIEILLDVALRERNEELAQRHAVLAKKIAMRYRVRLPYRLRQLFCKKCKSFIVPGRTSRVRVGQASAKAVIMTCTKCEHIYRRTIAE